MNEWFKGEQDSRFIQKIRQMDLAELEVCLARHTIKSAPRWKRVAIRRRIAMFRPCSLEWIMGLHELNSQSMNAREAQVYISTLDRIRDL